MFINMIKHVLFVPGLSGFHITVGNPHKIICIRVNVVNSRFKGFSSFIFPC